MALCAILAACSAPEIVAALELGADITMRHGVVVPTDHNLRIFGDFIQDCLAKRSGKR